jgi:hypothetical protein
MCSDRIVEVELNIACMDNLLYHAVASQRLCIRAIRELIGRPNQSRVSHPSHKHIRFKGVRPVLQHHDCGIGITLLSHLQSTMAQLSSAAVTSYTILSGTFLILCAFLLRSSPTITTPPPFPGLSAPSGSQTPPGALPLRTCWFWLSACSAYSRVMRAGRLPAVYSLQVPATGKSALTLKLV